MPDEPPPSPSTAFVLGDAALYAPAGAAVRTLEPHTEAHPAAILLQLLSAQTRRNPTPRELSAPRALVF